MRALSLKLCKFSTTNRNIITPEPFIMQPLDDKYLINSKNYSFITTSKPNFDHIYEHYSDTPSTILKKPGMHIFPEKVGYTGIQQKYNAHLRRMQDNYREAFEKCASPTEVFHLERRVKSEIRSKCRFIGMVSARYKHYQMFESLDQIRSRRTLEEYQKNGVKVKLLNDKTIYPHGPVWLPTSQEYLKLFHNFIHSNLQVQVQPTTTTTTILDLGCGSGVLSFLLSKCFKSSQIWAIDSNKHAVQTTEINAATLGLTNINALLMDYTNKKDLQFNLSSNQAPLQYDLVVSNPPWITAKRTAKESVILDGVYDDQGKCLQSTFQIFRKCMKNEKSRLILIYSDLSSILGLQKKSVEQLAEENNLLIHSKTDIPYQKGITGTSRLNSYKDKARIFLYELGSS